MITVWSGIQGWRHNVELRGESLGRGGLGLASLRTACGSSSDADGQKVRCGRGDDARAERPRVDVVASVRRVLLPASGAVGGGDMRRQRRRPHRMSIGRGGLRVRGACRRPKRRSAAQNKRAAKDPLSHSRRLILVPSVALLLACSASRIRAPRDVIGSAGPIMSSGSKGGIEGTATQCHWVPGGEYKKKLEQENAPRRRALRRGRRY